MRRGHPAYPHGPTCEANDGNPVPAQRASGFGGCTLATGSPVVNPQRGDRGYGIRSLFVRGLVLQPGYLARFEIHAGGSK